MAKNGIAMVTGFLKKCTGFEKCMRNVKIVSAENGVCVAELKVEHEHTNIMGSLHGGFSATLVDVISSSALLVHDNGQVPSVSVDMNMTYLKGAKMGTEIIIDAKTLRIGKTLAFLNVDIKNKSTGELLVQGSHTKFLMRP